MKRFKISESNISISGRIYDFNEEKGNNKTIDYVFQFEDAQEPWVIWDKKGRNLIIQIKGEWENIAMKKIMKEMSGHVSWWSRLKKKLKSLIEI